MLLGTPNGLSGRAERDSRLIVFPEEAFWNLLRLSAAVSGEIFRTMATRLRNIEGSARQQEKLQALGTMSASLEVIGVWRIKIPNESRTCCDLKILFSSAANRIFRSMTTILTYSYKLTHSPA